MADKEEIASVGWGARELCFGVSDTFYSGLQSS